jgi:hypothetical protein
MVMLGPIELQVMKIGFGILVFCSIYAVVYSMVEASRRRQFEQKLLDVLLRADENVLASQSSQYTALLSIEKNLRSRY